MRVPSRSCSACSRRVEQVGTPDELYDTPANDFVMRFLGPTTQLGGQVVRPHDIDIHVGAPGIDIGCHRGRVRRIQRVGFAVRVNVDTETGEDTVVHLTRHHLRSAGIAEGDVVWLSVHNDATSGIGAAAV